MQGYPEPTAPQARARVLDWLASQQQAMQDLLQKVVNIDSGSRDERRVTAVAHVLAERLQAAGVPVQFEPVPGYGVLLRAQVNAAGRGRPIIMGHMDTVFPPTSVAKRPYREEGWARHGPIADMKSGLVLNVFVAEALCTLRWPERRCTCFFACDEEIGSRHAWSHHGLCSARAVFNAGARPHSGIVVTSRKGSDAGEFEVEGVAAHAGINHAAGASAIDSPGPQDAGPARADRPCHWRHRQRGCGARRCGVQHGGPHARAELDLRFTADTNPEDLLARVRAIIEEESVPRTQGRITVGPQHLAHETHARLPSGAVPGERAHAGL